MAEVWLGVGRLGEVEVWSQRNIGCRNRSREVDVVR